jgi:hypothetical protein
MRKGIIIANAIAVLTLALGCMSFSFGGRTEVVAPHPPSGTADVAGEQKGNVQVAGGEEMTVYYPVPFATPPNLVIRDPAAACRVVEQRADCFRVRNTASVVAGNYEVGWTARGVQVPPSNPTATPTSPVVANPTTH